MERFIRKEIMPGVFLTTAAADKFKTNYIGINMIRPLKSEDASLLSLTPWVLRRGNAVYPDMQSFSAALDDMYGAWIEPSARKKGETLTCGFVCSVPDDKYVPDKGLFKGAVTALCNTLLNPVLENGIFKDLYVDGERTNLIERIRAQINDKRLYARNRLIEIMCKDEAFGVNHLGSEDSAQAITSAALYDNYRKILASSRIEIFFCGSTGREYVEEALLKALISLPRNDTFDKTETKVIRKAGNIKNITEALDVVQGKLSMGFRSGTIEGEEAFPAMCLLNGIYGAGLTSKLFMNVREKLSLCYYASSSLDRAKGIMTVLSGIEFDKFEAARDEILTQLEACRKGNIEDWELDGARAAMVNALKMTLDSQGMLEDYYLTQAVTGVMCPPEELAERIAGVERNKVIEAAGLLSLDTVYFLKGAGV